jgi:hypothetical protein
LNWYPIVLSVFAGVFLLRNQVDQRLKSLGRREHSRQFQDLQIEPTSSLDQAMVLSIIASSLSAGVAPQIAIRAGLNYLPTKNARPYFALLDGLNLSGKEDFLLKNLRFLLESVENGNQVVSTLQNKIEVFQVKHKLKILTSIKKAEIWMLAPLGICFLPTFIFLTIIPLLASMLGNLFN